MRPITKERMRKLCGLKESLSDSSESLVPADFAIKLKSLASDALSLGLTYDEAVEAFEKAIDDAYWTHKATAAQDEFDNMNTLGEPKV